VEDTAQHNQGGNDFGNLISDSHTTATQTVFSLQKLGCLKCETSISWILRESAFPLLELLSQMYALCDKSYKVRPPYTQWNEQRNLEDIPFQAVLPTTPTPVTPSLSLTVFHLQDSPPRVVSSSFKLPTSPYSSPSHQPLLQPFPPALPPAPPTISSSCPSHKPHLQTFLHSSSSASSSPPSAFFLLLLPYSFPCPFLLQSPLLSSLTWLPHFSLLSLLTEVRKRSLLYGMLGFKMEETSLIAEHGLNRYEIWKKGPTFLAILLLHCLVDCEGVSLEER